MNSAEMLSLAKTAGKGNPDAYGRLIAEHQEYLYRTAWVFVRNEELALDAVGTAVLKAYQSIRTLKKPEYFKTWLTRILIRAAQDELKKLVYYDSSGEPAAQETHEEISIEEKCDINSAVAQLPEKYRTVIILKYFNELSVKEIAEVIDAPEGSVKAYLSRARAELKKN